MKKTKLIGLLTSIPAICGISCIATSCSKDKDDTEIVGTRTYSQILIGGIPSVLDQYTLSVANDQRNVTWSVSGYPDGTAVQVQNTQSYDHGQVLVGIVVGYDQPSSFKFTLIATYEGKSYQATITVNKP